MLAHAAGSPLGDRPLGRLAAATTINPRRGVDRVRAANAVTVDSTPTQGDVMTTPDGGAETGLEPRLEPSTFCMASSHFRADFPRLRKTSTSIGRLRGVESGRVGRRAGRRAN